MKNLSVLLVLKREKHSHVVLSDNGTYSGMTNGSKGTVKPIDEALAQELFGEYPLTEKNFANFRLLVKIRLAKVKKAKEPLPEQRTKPGKS